jgi:RNase P/RNase MRP subunit POP5
VCEANVLQVDVGTQTCIVQTSQNDLRAVWLGLNCVSQIGNRSCVLVVTKVSSSLVGVMGGDPGAGR